MPGLNKIRNVLFDLDGTLVDSSETITASIVHALRKFSINPDNGPAVTSWIGVPLFDIFIGGYGMSEAQTVEAIDHYREHYDALNQAGSRVYPDVPEMLEDLQSKGYSLYIATVKPTRIAEKVLEDMSLRSFFSGVAGASMGPERRGKTGIIAHALKKFGLAASQTMMIGDRDQDIDGARANGLQSLGVSYGFGGREEVERSGADHVVDHSLEIAGLLAPAG